MLIFNVGIMNINDSVGWTYVITSVYYQCWISGPNNRLTTWGDNQRPAHSAVWRDTLARSSMKLWVIDLFVAILQCILVMLEILLKCSICITPLMVMKMFLLRINLTWGAVLKFKLSPSSYLVYWSLLHVLQGYPRVVAISFYY